MTDDISEEIWVKGGTAYTSEYSVYSCNRDGTNVVLAKDSPDCVRYTRAAPKQTDGWRPIVSYASDGEISIEWQDRLLIDVDANGAIGYAIFNGKNWIPGKTVFDLAPDLYAALPPPPSVNDGKEGV